MCETPDNNLRLENLKLDGLKFGTLVLACVNCDYQTIFAGRIPSMCPRCHRQVGLAVVGPELLRKAKAA